MYTLPITNTYILKKWQAQCISVAQINITESVLWLVENSGTIVVTLQDLFIKFSVFIFSIFVLFFQHECSCRGLHGAKI